VGLTDVLSKLGGEFVDRTKEQAFRRSTLAEARGHVRLAVMVAALGFGVFVVLDLMLGSSHEAWPVWQFTACRAVVLAAAVVVLWFLPRVREPVHLDRAQMAFQMVFILAASVVYYLANGRMAAGDISAESVILTWVSLYLVLALSYLAFLTPFAWALTVNAVAAVLFSVASLLPHGTPTPQRLGQVALVVVVSLLGAVLLRHMNRLRRGQFAALNAASLGEDALRRLFMAVPVPLALTRLTDGRLIKTNAAALATFGFTAEEADGQSTERLYVDPVRRHALVDAVRRDGAVAGFETDLLLGDGSIRTFLLSATRVCHCGEDCIIVGATDITDRKRMEESLMRLASTDQLTGLANRHHFFSLGEALQARARRLDEPLGVLMMDLDNFKSINDSYGHDIGDLVLLTFAQLCRSIFRESDVVARIGGEEFAVLLPATDLDGGLLVAERLRERVESYHVIPHSGGILRFTVSIGVAELEFDESKLDAALMRADRALYHAKRTGRNCVGCVAEREQAASA